MVQVLAQLHRLSVLACAVRSPAPALGAAAAARRYTNHVQGDCLPAALSHGAQGSLAEVLSSSDISRACLKQYVAGALP